MDRVRALDTALEGRERGIEKNRRIPSGVPIYLNQQKNQHGRSLNKKKRIERGDHWLGFMCAVRRPTSR